MIMTQEITARYRAEEARRQSEKRLQEEVAVTSALARVGQELISEFNAPAILERV